MTVAPCHLALGRGSSAVLGDSVAALQPRLAEAPWAASARRGGAGAPGRAQSRSRKVRLSPLDLREQLSDHLVRVRRFRMVQAALVEEATVGEAMPVHIHPLEVTCLVRGCRDVLPDVEDLLERDSPVVAYLQVTKSNRGSSDARLPRAIVQSEHAL